MLSEYNWRVTTKESNDPWELGEYKILHDESGVGTFSADNSQTSLVYLCEYQYHQQFLDVVLGKTVYDGGILRRSASNPSFDGKNGSLPEPHPYYPNFVATSATVTPMGTSQNNLVGPEWKKLKIHVVFRAPDYNIVPDGVLSYEDEMNRFTRIVSEPQADFQTVNGTFKFVSDVAAERTALTNAPGMVVTSYRMNYTWMQIPVVANDFGYPNLKLPPNTSTIDQLQGRLNELEFDGHPPGTVLFVAPVFQLVRPQIATANNYYWNIGYCMSIRDYGESLAPFVTDEHIGHNYAFDVLAGKWRGYSTTGTVLGRTSYLYGDLNDLFKVTW